LLNNTTPALRATPPQLRRGILRVYPTFCAKRFTWKNTRVIASKFAGWHDGATGVGSAQGMVMVFGISVAWPDDHAKASNGAPAENSSTY